MACDEPSAAASSAASSASVVDRDSVDAELPPLAACTGGRGRGGGGGGTGGGGGAGGGRGGGTGGGGGAGGGSALASRSFVNTNSTAVNSSDDEAGSVECIRLRSLRV